MFSLARRRSASLLAILALVVVLATGCGSSSDTANTGEVRIALQPLFDYALWPFAQEHGLAEEQGLDLRFTWLSSIGPQVQALRRGSVDMISTCTACNFPYYKSAPTLRDVLVTDQFKGFILVGRKGAPTYDALIKDGSSPDQARQTVFRYLKGKTFVIHKPVFGALVSGMLENAGLKPSDVKIVDLADDAKAATAFLKGDGDFYVGSLAQETKLLLDHGDRFVNVGGTPILGPAGLWYSTAAVDDQWLKDNHDATLKLLAIWYRASRYLNERPDLVLPVIRENVNRQAGASFTLEQTKFTINEFLKFPSAKEARQTVYGPSSELYWKRSLDYYAAQHRQDGDLPQDINVEPFNVEEQLFRELLGNEKLMAWINRPLT